MTRLTVTIAAAVVLCSGPLLIGCAPFTMYRDKPSSCSAPDAASVVEACRHSSVQIIAPGTAEQPGYVMSFIEFDDQGQMWEPLQLRALEQAMQSETSDGADDYLMVVFVHGWKHNAGWHGHDATEDGNVTSFRDAMAGLSRTEAQLSAKICKPPRKVIGVYIGWRGESIDADYLDDLSFWDRKNTAHKVGHGEVAQVLEHLELIRQARLARKSDSRSRLIVVGHSFGGAVVYSALEQILEARFLESTRVSPATAPTQGATDAPRAVAGFGNLVVLLNPAFEAELYAPISDLANTFRSYSLDQLPVLAVLTSEADSATGIAFPIGRWFSTRFEKQRWVARINPVTGLAERFSQKQADVDAVGHYAPYKTHDLVATEASARSTPGVKGSPQAPLVSPQTQSLEQAAASSEWEQDGPGHTIHFNGSTLTRSENSAGRDPYLVVNVDKALIANHDDIWRAGIREFITHLILIASQSDNLGERNRDRAAEAQHQEGAGQPGACVQHPLAPPH